jgi:nickel transport protein
MRKHLHIQTLMFAVLCIFAAESAFAHGVTANSISSKTVAVRFGYAGGDPMSYAEVLVFAPTAKEGDAEFQNGRTDALGNFAFVPNIPGIWRISSSDMGHRAEMQIKVTEQGIIQAKAPTGLSSQTLRIVLGLSLILNLLAACLFLKRSTRKKLMRQTPCEE